MQVLIIGNGGREHAMAWKAAQSPLVSHVYVAPGNAGTAREDKVSNVDIEATDIPALIQFAKEHAIELTLVGPEAPLSMGVVDQFKEAALNCFGPSQEAAMLESSKSFAKLFMQQNHIPTAKFAVFSESAEALAYLDTKKMPIVVKASGLAAGKGVVVAQTLAEAKQAVTQMLDEAEFGEAGAEVVIEEFLTGEEASFMVLSDGQVARPLATSQDHKARDDGDLGPNTGGMGACSPALAMNASIEAQVMKTIVEPVLRGMRQRGTPFVGFLYVGLMVDEEGIARVVEFNCRLGDPETEVLMLRLRSDLIEHCQACLTGQLAIQQIEWDPRCALGVVLTAGGYPQKYEQGDVIHGLEAVSLSMAQQVFHAGTRPLGNEVVTAGGRVLCVTVLADTFHQAQAKVYDLAQKIEWRDIYYRRDIGYRALLKEEKACQKNYLSQTASEAK